jgi:hypothetical protein
MGGFDAGKIRIQSHTCTYRGEDLDDLVDIMKSAFSAAVTDGWCEEERQKWNSAILESLSEVEKATASIEMVAFIALAEK